MIGATTLIDGFTSREARDHLAAVNHRAAESPRPTPSAPAPMPRPKASLDEDIRGRRMEGEPHILLAFRTLSGFVGEQSGWSRQGRGRGRLEFSAGTNRREDQALQAFDRLPLLLKIVVLDIDRHGDGRSAA